MSTDDNTADETTNPDNSTDVTLEDRWDENPDPPEQYGRPGPRTIMDDGEDTTYAWSWNKQDDGIEYDGELAWVVR